jgi:hypothetical protein
VYGFPKPPPRRRRAPASSPRPARRWPMDGSRFDALARRAAAPRSRRRLLRALGGALAGALLGGGAAAAEDCKGTGKACSKGSQCCSGNCTPAPGKTSVAASGAICGTIPNGCGGPDLDCGTCAAPQTCGGGGAANVCGCTPDSVATTCAGTCGPQTNNCGQGVDCGPCCTPTTCEAAGVSCGTISDNCGGTLNCCGSGRECVHGACFAVCDLYGGGNGGCNGGCSCLGSVDGSGNYLCATQTGTPCQRTSDCPAREACTSGVACVAPC